MVTGILWSVFSATVAFLYAATWMILSVAASGWLRPAVNDQEIPPHDPRLDAGTNTSGNQRA
jgi:hypothetical protein